MTSPVPVFLTTAQACEFVGLSENTLRKYAAQVGIDKVPYVNRWAAADLARLPDLLREYAASEADRMRKT